MQELIIRGSRYRIREEEPPKGWEPSARYVLEHITTGQSSKRGKVEHSDQVRRMLRTTSREACIRYIADIERVPLFMVRAGIIRKQRRTNEQKKER
jgi:hypothetical protein